MYKGRTVGLVIPAYNEEASVGLTVRGFIELFGQPRGALFDDIVVCNNGSTDRTREIAIGAGARVITETRRGYGSACLAALSELSDVDIVLFADADRSDNPAESYQLLDAIISGADLVIGSRALGRAEPGSLTPQQKFGNALASWLIRSIWRHPTTDLGPFRAIRRSSLDKLAMRDRDYGWTVEMQVKAIQQGMKVTEVPVCYLKRIGKSKISGTIRGTIGAGTKILFTIGRLCLTKFGATAF